MAKKNTKRRRTSWNSVLDSINRRRGPKQTIPNDDELDHFAGLLTHELPRTYRQFIKRFGAGQLSGWCHFWSPAAATRSDWDIFHWNLNHKKSIIDFYDGSDVRARRLVLFGTLNSGMNFGWDPDGIVSDRPREYTIYAVARHLDETFKLADTFPEFIEDFCMGDGLLDFCFFDSGDDFNYPRRDFRPV